MKIPLAALPEELAGRIGDAQAERRGRAVAFRGAWSVSDRGAGHWHSGRRLGGRRDTA